MMSLWKCERKFEKSCWINNIISLDISKLLFQKPNPWKFDKFKETIFENGNNLKISTLNLQTASLGEPHSYVSKVILSKKSIQFYKNYINNTNYFLVIKYEGSV